MRHTRVTIDSSLAASLVHRMAQPVCCAHHTMTTAHFISILFVSSMLTACGSGPGSDSAPTPTAISVLVGNALTHQADAARWIDPAIGSGTGYVLKDLASVEVIGAVEMLENGKTAKVKVQASGTYRMTVSTTPTAQTIVVAEVPTAAGQAPKAPKVVQAPAATIAVTKHTGEKNFRKTFTVYLGSQDGTWDLR